jgi:hypothetical protein
VLRKLFRLNRDYIMGGWRRLHKEELHNLNSSPSIIRVMKLMRMRWAGHEAQMGETRNAYWILVRKKETLRKAKM